MDTDSHLVERVQYTNVPISGPAPVPIRAIVEIRTRPARRLPPPFSWQ